MTESTEAVAVNRQSLIGKMRAPHKTVRIPIKFADVDELMVPVIEFINSRDGIITYACCEGSETSRPYISWFCTNYSTTELGSVLHKLDFAYDVSHRAVVEVRYNPLRQVITYRAEWQSREAFKGWLDTFTESRNGPRPGRLSI